MLSIPGLCASNFTAHGLRPSISVHTPRGQKTTLKNVAPLLTNDQNCGLSARCYGGNREKVRNSQGNFQLRYVPP